MDVEKIYFDMDGVLADFDRGVKELCNLTPKGQDDYTEEEELHLWDEIRKVGHFYDKLEIMPGSYDMFMLLYEKYGDKCEILTGIPRPSRGIVTSVEDKVNWTRRLLSKDIKIHTVARKDKKNYCTGKGCILIDDYDKTTKEWDALGGTTVLFTDAESAMKRLKELGVIDEEI